MICDMACDYLIYKCKKKPTKEGIGSALVDYLGNTLIKELRWGEDRWLITITGERSNPLKYLVDHKSDGGRWFEV